MTNNRLIGYDYCCKNASLKSDSNNEKKNPQPQQTTTQ